MYGPARARCSMSARTTRIPSTANRFAIARPMPLAAPVTTATLPLKSCLSVLPGRPALVLDCLPPRARGSIAALSIAQQA